MFTFSQFKSTWQLQCICSSQANSPQPSRVLSTAPASTSTAYASRMVPAYSNAPWPVTLSHRHTGQWDAPEHSWRQGGSRQRHIGPSRLHTHASRNITHKAVFFQYNSSSPLLIFGHRAVLFWDWLRNTLHTHADYGCMKKNSSWCDRANLHFRHAINNAKWSQTRAFFGTISCLKKPILTTPKIVSSKRIKCNQQWVSNIFYVCRQTITK